MLYFRIGSSLSDMPDVILPATARMESGGPVPTAASPAVRQAPENYDALAGEACQKGGPAGVLLPARPGERPEGQDSRAGRQKHRR